jgi:hypothetical protein
MTDRQPGGTLVPVLAMLALAILAAAPRLLAGQPLPPEGGATAPAAAQASQRRVLLLYGEPRLYPAIVTVDERIREILRSRSPVPVTLYTEYLDLNLFDGGVPQTELRELLRRKYMARPLDLIVAAASPALRIALRNRTELFSGAPVVFLAVDPTAAADLQLDPDVTGVWLHQGWAETLELARRLQPSAQRAVVIGGSSSIDRVWLDQARRQLAAPPGSIEIRYLAGLGFDDLLKEVAAILPRTVILVGAFVRDGAGRDFLTPEATARIADAARVPVYGLTEGAVGSGIVGGHVVSFGAHGQAAAELALRVLAGERPPPTDAGTTVPMFDARQLDRWGLDARRLPPGSVVRFREPSLWEQHRWTVIGGSFALLLQTGLIAGLLVQRAKRRRAQKSVAERLRFETLLSDLSSRFATSSGRDAEGAVQRGLQTVGEGLGVDWATVRVLDEKGDEARLAHVWTREGVTPRPAVIREDQTPLDLLRAPPWPRRPARRPP